jgi:hypothetical protein
MTQQTQVDPTQLKRALSQYCPEEVIDQVSQEGQYDNDPYWFIYNCLIQTSKNDETTIIRWNKVLRDLGFTSVMDDGKGWIAHNEPAQGIILDPRIIKQVKTFGNYNRRKDVRVSEASGYIPSEKEKNDPRFKTALTVDVHPDSIKKNAKAFYWNTSRAGIPPTAKANGKIY